MTSSYKKSIICLYCEGRTELQSVNSEAAFLDAVEECMQQILGQSWPTKDQPAGSVVAWWKKGYNSQLRLKEPSKQDFLVMMLWFVILWIYLYKCSLRRTPQPICQRSVSYSKTKSIQKRCLTKQTSCRHHGSPPNTHSIHSSLKQHTLYLSSLANQSNPLSNSIDYVFRCKYWFPVNTVLPSWGMCHETDFRPLLLVPLEGSGSCWPLSCYPWAWGASRLTAGPKTETHSDHLSGSWIWLLTRYVLRALFFFLTFLSFMNGCHCQCILFIYTA